jgi:hypothetical protein
LNREWDNERKLLEEEKQKRIREEEQKRELMEIETQKRIREAVIAAKNEETEIENKMLSQTERLKEVCYEDWNDVMEKENQRDEENEDMENEGDMERECGEQDEEEISDEEVINSENESVFNVNETMDIEDEGGENVENNKIEKKKEKKEKQKKRKENKKIKSADEDEGEGEEKKREKREASSSPIMVNKHKSQKISSKHNMSTSNDDSDNVNVNDLLVVTENLSLLTPVHNSTRNGSMTREKDAKETEVTIECEKEDEPVTTSRSFTLTVELSSFDDDILCLLVIFRDLCTGLLPIMGELEAPLFSLLAFSSSSSSTAD